MGRRKRRTKTDRQDRLSELPEPLIVQILSLLEMKDAVKTGILSKRWKYLWTQIDNIIYNRRCPIKDNEENMSYVQKKGMRYANDVQWISFVDRTLMQCTSSNIKTFSLSGVVQFYPDMLYKWIAFLVDKKVETLKLEIICPTPECLFQSSTITKLELFNMRVYTSKAVNLTSLKSLLLERVYIVDAVIDNILIGSPVLENLALRDCRGICLLNIMSPSVKILNLWNFVSEVDVFNIKAPWLQELKISGQFTVKECELVDVPSLLKATLTFHPHFYEIFESTDDSDMEVTEYNYSWIPMVTKLLKSLSYVGELIIGSEPLQVLSMSKLSGTPSPLFMCKHLSIKTYLWKFDLPGIACLLENAPHLESLLIKVVPFSFDPEDAFPFYRTQSFFQDGDPHLNMPNGKFSHLKNVKVEYCQTLCDDNISDDHGGFFDFELVEYILKSAVVLEKLVLCSPRGWSCSNNTSLALDCSSQYLSRLCYNLIITIMSLTGNKASGWELKESTNKLKVFVFSNYASLLSKADSSSSSM